MKKTMIVTLAITAALAMCSMSAPAAEKTGILQIDGSTTVGPIADAFAEVFKKKYPDATFTVKKTGSGDGAAALIDGRCDIATMSRYMKAEEIKKAVDKGVFPTAHAIAMDGVCVVVHPSNPVTNLTKQQIHDIYTGKITNWKQVGGPNARIVLAGRTGASGTYEFFKSSFLGGTRQSAKTKAFASNGMVRSYVARNRYAIGYVSIAFLNRTIRGLAINGVAPTKKNALAGRYPHVRNLYFITKTKPSGATAKFINWCLSKSGQAIAAKEYMSIR